jgi:hypothetical protein
VSEPASAGGRGRKWALGVAKFLLGAAIFGALVWWLGPNWDEVQARFHFSWGWFAVSFSGSALATAFAAARWKVLNERMTSTRLGYGAYFHYIALTRFVGQFTSLLFMDLVGRSVGLKAAGSDQGIGRLITPVLLERLLDLLLPITVFGWALAVHGTSLGEHRVVSLALLLLAFAIVIVPLVQPIARFAIGAYVRVKRWRGAVIEEQVVDVSSSTAVWVSVYSVGRFATVLLQFVGAGAAAGALLPWDVLVSAFSVQQLTAIIAITPGGLGVQEAGWAGGLRWLGEPVEVITLFLLATRVFVILNFGLLSLVTLPLGGKRR